MRQEGWIICPRLRKMSEERQELNLGPHFTAQSMFKMLQYDLYKLTLYYNQLASAQTHNSESQVL